MVLSDHDHMRLLLRADLLELSLTSDSRLNPHAIRCLARDAADDFISDGSGGYASRNGESLADWVARHRETGLSPWAFAPPTAAEPAEPSQPAGAMTAAERLAHANGNWAATAKRGAR
jgi:hypothetical protein